MKTNRFVFIAASAALLALAAPTLHGGLQVKSAAAKAPHQVLIIDCDNDGLSAKITYTEGSTGTTPPSDSTTCSQALANALSEGFSLASSVTSTDSLVVYTLSHQ
ncbi:MAG: hypothetical protein WBY93_24290 [Candidatus Binatus sp.]